MKLSAKEFMASIRDDNILYHEEIVCSIAHSRMLVEHEMLSREESEQIIEALEEIDRDIKNGKIRFDTDAEDIHEYIENLLVERVGTIGRKLHRARSVNDQVVMDSRLFLKNEAISCREMINDLLDTLEVLATEHQNTIIPGYSHLQRAQPITLAYHLLAYYQMFKRDGIRFDNCIECIDMMPPDSGALAGTILETDRSEMMKELGFASMLPNAMDAISDRDFAMEFTNCCAITMMHLSRFCEDLILWSSVEFDFIEIADKYTTGSKMMPKKKNLDVAELIRGKTGRVYGDLINLLTVFKGLPMAYNRDMQEDKYAVLDAANTLESSLSLFVEMVKTIKINRGEMQKAAKYGYMNAVELSQYLYDKGVDYDEIPEIVSKVIGYAINRGSAIEELWLDDLKNFSQKFDSDVYDEIAIRNVIESKKSTGSTSFKSVEEQLAQIKRDKKRK
ncbi:MAG: argininosuccinate lyase [Firmicutes bacterium]|nr:argininosuccinate lyase [Bacillota bacterium]